MPYTITRSQNCMAVPERQYAIAHEIRFTAFTSCIGVVAQNNKKEIIGVHLGLYGTPANNEELAPMVTVHDITQLMHFLHSKDYKKSSAIILGEIGAWKQDQNVPQVYKRLEGVLGLTGDDSRQHDWGSGIYGARYSAVGNSVNGNISLFNSGVWF